MLSLVEILRNILILLVVCILIVILKWLYTKIKISIVVWGVKGPTNYLFLGVLYYALKIKNTEDIVQFMQSLHEKYGTLFKIWLGPILLMSASKPRDLEIILNSNKCIDKSIFYHNFKVFAPTGIGAVNNPTWKQNRRIIKSILNHNMIESFFDKIYVNAEQINIILEGIVKNTKDNDETHIFQPLEVNLLELICDVLFDIPPAEKELGAEIFKTFIETTEFEAEYFHKSLSYIDPIFDITSEGRRRTKLIQNYYKTTKKMVENKRHEIGLTENEQNDSSVHATFFDTKQFLETLIVKYKLTDNQLHNEIVHFLTAGVDSICTVVCYTLMCLGIFPEIQERVYQEIKTVVGDGRKLAKEDIPKLVYLERVIFETLRIFPVAQNLSREVTESMEITDNVVIPTGTTLLISIYHVHMNPDYWPDPWKYDPDRFLSENVSKRDPYTFLAFSGGIRNCIGYKYAKMVLKILLYNILLQFRVECGYTNVREVRHEMKFLNSPVLGYKLRLKKRN